jgi:hypothetical protein
MLPYLDEKTVLPTSEDIEKKLPFRSDTPVSRAATGLGTLGGGFYYGPGSPLRLAGALPSAIKRGAQDFALASAAGAPHVIKPYGGNWLSGQDRLTVPENDLRRLKTQTIAGETPEQRIPKHEELLKDPTLNQDQIDRVLYQLEQTKGEAAIDKWIDSNLKNYVKKEMSTPDDPVRKLAEEGIIHTPLRDDLDRAGYLEDTRKAEGYPAEGMGKSDLARRWENLSDDAIRVTKAGAIQDQANTGAKLAVARAELDAYKKQIDEDFIALLKDKGGLNEKDREVFDRMPSVQKAEILGDTKYKELQGNINTLLGRESGFEKAAGDLNPFVTKLDPETRLYSGSTYNLGFDHIVDVLREDVAAGRIRPEQLSKVSMEQAVRRTAEYDQEMAKKMAQAQAKITEGMPTIKEYPEGYKWIQLAPPKELPKGYSAILDDVTGSYKVVDEDGKEAFPRKPDKLGHINVPFFKTADEAIADALKRDPRLEEALKYEGDTMGHCVGGYCDDVREGNSNIFSLRDAKGEPHVTVEVRPKKYDNYALPVDKWFESQPEAVKNAINESGFKGYNVRYSPQYKEAVAAMPPDIIQIKGKGNAKPKEQYLPFVQDFVKGSKWSDVGDLQNTGLQRVEANTTPPGFAEWMRLRALGNEPKVPAGYYTPEELAKYGEESGLKERYPSVYGTWRKNLGLEPDVPLEPPPPMNEMKRGGMVSTTHDQMMAKGGKAVKELVELGAEEVKKLLGMAKEAPKGVEPIVVKPSERAAAGRKAAELIKSQPQIKASEALGRMKEKGFKKTTTTQADRTRVGGGNIGGAPFSAISEADPLYAGKVWGVMDEGTASRLINLTDPETAWTTMLGSADQLKTNPIVFDKLKKQFLESMKAGNLSPELEARINHNLALNFGEGAQIRDPSVWKNADTFEKRAALADLMMGQGIPPSKGGVALGGEKSGKGVIFRPTDTLIRETEPSLLHPEHGGSAPTFAAGPRLFSMEKSATYRPDLHPGVPTLIEGKDLGVNMLPTPTEIYLPDWHRAFRQKKPERFQGPWAEDIIARRKSGSYKLGGAEGPGYYDLALGLKGEGLPSQDLTDDYIRHLIREGFKAGGAVGGLSRVTKSCACDD